MKQIYSISVGRELNRVKEVMEALFLLGFVFNAEDRFRTWADVRNIYWVSTLEGFTHLLINADEYCKMVIHPLSYYDDRDFLERYIPIDLDDFIKQFKEGTICL